MSSTLVLWAQALDNSSPDHFAVQGKSLAPDDSVGRQQAVSIVSGVIRNGARIFNQRGVLLTADGHHFVVEVPAEQRDRTGRTAPIVCCGDYTHPLGESAATSTVRALDDFAGRIGRTLQPDHFELVRAAFEALKKKSGANMGVRLLVLVGVVLLALVSWLVHRGW